MISQPLSRASVGGRPSSRVVLGFLAIAGSALLAGCATQKVPDTAYRLPPTSLEVREIQSRTYTVPSDETILAASVAVLQDMEYNLDNVEKPLGVLSASKVTDADSTSEKTGLFMLDLLCALGNGAAAGNCHAMDNASDKQKVAVTLVVLPSLAKKGDYVARVTVQRIVYNKKERVILMEPVVDAETYQKIFEKLSQSIFLQVNQ